MDRKTLEYMTNRVKKGHEILDRINRLNLMKRRVGAEHLVAVYASLEGEHGADYRFGRGRGMESHDPWEANTQKRMITVLVEEIDAEIARLEAELAEL